jgi:alpha-L-fucosidase
MKKNVIVEIILVLLIFCSNQIFAASCGDVNSGGSTDIVDALLIAQYYVGSNPANFNVAVADVNGNATTDIVDALLVAQFYVGLISQLSCAPVPTSPPVGDIWALPALPIASGSYQPNYDSLRTYYTPAWFRDAKLGLWQHWDPQSVPEQGDWYARGMYQQGSSQYNYHVSHYGHPSVFGYKDICNLFTASNWDPVALIDQYVKTGAKYAVCLANHHDNFDMWNSAYQPWNVMNVGPKKDIMGLFATAAKNKGLRFGMTFHATPPRTWGQFMPVKYGSDSGGQYDGLMTKADGAGKWWNGMDPKDLYGPNHSATNPSLTSPFANQFMWRVDDAITKYHPDLIYFDEHAGHTQVDLGVNMGLDFLSPQICANYYNKAYGWNGGKTDDVVCNMKGIGGTYNSFQGEDDVLEKAYHSMVPDTEKVVDATIQAYAFQIDESLGDWHYLSGMGFKSSANVISILADIVSKNGNLLLCLPTHGNGSLEPASVTICNEIGSWLSQNGEAIYGSRPFEVCQESGGVVRFTRRAGYVYAIATSWPSNNQLVLSALKQKSNSTIGNVQKVEFLGSSLSFSQNTSSLTITCPSSHTNSQAYVFRITHDKPWINDDDFGVKYTGYWKHQANRGLGDYNNDGYFTQISGATCEYTFNGTGIEYISEKYSDMGNVDVYMDGVFKQNVNLNISGARQVQQVVYSITGLANGSHTIKIVNKGTQYGNVDAFRIF